jgi:hypothetical protein
MGFNSVFKGLIKSFMQFNNVIAAEISWIRKKLNPFQSNFSANRTLPSSYLFWAVKRLVDYL